MKFERSSTNKQTNKQAARTEKTSVLMCLILWGIKKV